MDDDSTGDGDGESFGAGAPVVGSSEGAGDDSDPAGGGKVTGGRVDMGGKVDAGGKVPGGGNVGKFEKFSGGNVEIFKGGSVENGGKGVPVVDSVVASGFLFEPDGAAVVAGGIVGKAGQDTGGKVGSPPGVVDEPAP